MITNPIRLLRELRGAPLSIVLALQMVHQRVTQAWLEQMTGYTDKPVSDALAYLAEVGYADHTSSGWQLVGNCVQLPLPLEQIAAENLTAEPVENSDTTYQGRNNSDSSESLVVVVDNDQLININSTTTTELSEKVGKIPTPEAIPNVAEIRQVLDAAEALFDNPIMGDPRIYQDIDRLLGWIAQAYHGRQREKIKNPAGLIFWAFKTGADPGKKYKEHADDYLPERFLRACGQWTFDDEA